MLWLHKRRKPSIPDDHKRALLQGLRMIAEVVATQIDEGMDVLSEIPGAIARKYCGGGYGGCVLYLFNDPVLRDAAVSSIPELRGVEPFCRV